MTREEKRREEKRREEKRREKRRREEKRREEKRGEGKSGVLIFYRRLICIPVILYRRKTYSPV